MNLVILYFFAYIKKLIDNINNSISFTNFCTYSFINTFIYNVTTFIVKCIFKTIYKTISFFL